MLYSVKMRSAQGGAHEQGGRHISGAERIVRAATVEETAVAMIERAFHHSRGRADFVNLNIEEIPPKNLVHIPQLPIHTVETKNVEHGRKLAQQYLVSAGVTAEAAQAGMQQLAALPDSMRGAMLIAATDGRRLDTLTQRGVRVTNMDVDGSEEYQSLLEQLGLTDVHVREALVLASKVQAAPGIIAELCWSDDLDYTTGYVASRLGYFRFPHLKQLGSPVGGRSFFVEAGADIDKLIDYLENTPVLMVPQAVVKGKTVCKK